jgi:hypothetical protein
LRFEVPGQIPDTSRELLASLEVPEPWAGTTRASLELIDDLDRRIDAEAKALRRLGR